MFELACMAIGVLALAVVVIGVCVIALWQRVDALLNPYARLARGVEPKRVPVGKGGRR